MERRKIKKSKENRKDSATIQWLNPTGAKGATTSK